MQEIKTKILEIGHQAVERVKGIAQYGLQVIRSAFRQESDSSPVEHEAAETAVSSFFTEPNETPARHAFLVDDMSYDQEKSLSAYKSPFRSLAPYSIIDTVLERLTNQELFAEVYQQARRVRTSKTGPDYDEIFEKIQYRIPNHMKILEYDRAVMRERNLVVTIINLLGDVKSEEDFHKNPQHRDYTDRKEVALRKIISEQEFLDLERPFDLEFFGSVLIKFIESINHAPARR